ncbi:unnamed protein product [Aphanomyces euteiches]
MAATLSVLDAALESPVKAAPSDGMLFDFEATKVFADALVLTTSKREGIELDRRVVYFRGKDVRKRFPEANDIDSIGKSLIEHGFIHKCVRVKKTNNTGTTYTILQPTHDQEFTEDGVYTWMYEGPTYWRNFLSGSFLLALGSAVFYPAWPAWGQKMLWDSGVTVCLGVSACLALRFVVWLTVWIATGSHLRLVPQLPRLQPIFEVYPKKEKKYLARCFVLFVLLATGVYFAYYPPVCQKKGYLGLGQKLVKQAYKGTLLQRFSPQEKEFMYTVLRIMRRFF